MEFVRSQISNIDNHHYLTIVFGKKTDGQFSVNITKDQFMLKLDGVLANFSVNKEAISTQSYRDYINNGITYHHTGNNVECYVDSIIEEDFNMIGCIDLYLFLTKREKLKINEFPIDKDMDDIKEKSEIAVNIDNLFDIIFVTYGNTYYYKVVIPKYNIYVDNLIEKLDNITKFIVS